MPAAKCPAQKAGEAGERLTAPEAVETFGLIGVTHALGQTRELVSVGRTHGELRRER